jgi:hypothetical protein
MRIVSASECVPLSGPILVEGKTDLPIRFSLFPWNGNRKALSEAFEDFSDRTFVLLCSGFGE